MLTPPMIPLSRPSITEADHRALLEVLASGMLVQGKHVASFEDAVARYTGRAHAVAVSNGTAALHLALEAAGIGAGDEVLVPALTWPSPAHAVRLVGATPVLVDVCPEDWNVRGDALARARTARTKAAIAIDQFGNPVREAEILEATQGLVLIEDAACAIGSRFPDAACGTLGLASTLSFHPRKVLTTGEGGMVLTDDGALAERVRRLRNHGQVSVGVFAEPGGNHRMTEMAAVLGRGQLQRLDAILDARAAIAARYHAAMRGVRFQRQPEGTRWNAQTFGAVLPEGASATDRDRVVAAIRASGVEAGALSYALNRLASVDRASDACPVAESVVDRGFSLPLHPGLSLADQDRVVAAVHGAV